MTAIRCLPALLALALAQSAEAGCQDSPRPHVDWTGCSRNLLMLGGDDLTEGVFSRAVFASTLPRKLDEGLGTTRVRLEAIRCSPGSEDMVRAR